MITRIAFSTAGLIATLLAGCAGSGNEPRMAAARAVDTTVEGSVSVSSNVFGTPTFVANGRTLTGMNELSDNSQSFLQKYATTPSGSQSFAIFGNSGTAEVAVIASEGTNANDAFLGADFKRVGDTAIPVKGTSLMRGEYSGVVSETNNIGAYHDVDFFVNGEAAIEFDFANNSVSGEIWNRKVLSESGVEQTTVGTEIITLGATALNADGSYNGSALGGNLNRAAGESRSAGSFGGLVTGANGTETVGSVTINHADTPSMFTGDAAEVGVFHAIKQ